MAGMRRLLPLLLLPSCASAPPSDAPPPTATVATAAPQPAAPDHSCSVEVWYSGPTSYDAEGSGSSRREAEAQACEKACQVVKAEHGGDCADEKLFRRITQPGEQRGPKQYDIRCRYLLRSLRRHQASSAESFPAACRKAHAELCDKQDCEHGSLVEVGGLSLQDLFEMARQAKEGLDASGPEGDASCSLALRVTLRTASGEAKAEGKDAELDARARAAACKKLGTDDCSDPDRFRVVKTAKSMRFADGKMSQTVTIELAEVKPMQVSAKRGTRRDACAAALAKVCGEGACTAGPPAIVAVDGVKPHVARSLLGPPPGSLFGGE